MKEIWTKDEAEYHGKFVNFDRMWAFPKPVQKPHPPILMGGAGPHARQRAADFDGHWMPVGGRAAEPIAESLADLRARTEKAGRDPATATVSLFGAPADPVVLKRFAEAGVERTNFWLPPAPRDVVLPILDRYATLAS